MSKVNVYTDTYTQETFLVLTTNTAAAKLHKQKRRYLILAVFRKPRVQVNNDIYTSPVMVTRGGNPNSDIQNSKFQIP